MPHIRPNAYYVKSPELVVVTAKDQVYLKTNQGLFSFGKSSLAEVSPLLTALKGPVKGSDLTRLLAQVPAPISKLFHELLEEGIVKIQEGVPPRKKTFPCRHLVLGISGSVMAPQMVAISTALLASGFCERISVILTPSAMKFVGKKAFEAYGMEVWTEHCEKEGPGSPLHLRLAESADMVLVMPASAHFIHRLASGACSDLLSLVATSTRAPLVIAPSANRAMYEHPAVQRNIETIRDDLAWVIEPEQVYGAVDFSRGQEERSAYGYNPYQKNLASVLFEIQKLHRKR